MRLKKGYDKRWWCEKKRVTRWNSGETEEGGEEGVRSQHQHKKGGEQQISVANRKKKRKEKKNNFFFNDTANTEIYTLSLHDALTIFNIKNIIIIL